MYLVAGMVARSVAGPGVVVSFIIAAIASIFSGKHFSASLMLRDSRGKRGMEEGEGCYASPLIVDSQ